MTVRHAVGAALCAAIFLIAAPIVAADPEQIAAHRDAPTGPSSGAEALDAFLEEVDSLRADFVQTVTDGEGYELTREEGTLAVRRPDRFRWNYEGQVIVADGERLWLYDEELAQVTVRPLDQTLASTPAMLLSGGGTLHEHATVRELGAEDGLAWVAIEPKVQDTDFQSVRIGFRGPELAAMELVDGFGQTTRIEFHNVVRNPSIDDGVFAFEPPPGVDVIGDGSS